MPRPRDIPDGAEIIRTYAEFQWFLRAEAAGHFALLIVVGRPGLSKSVSIKDVLSDRPVCYIQGRATPIQVYIKLFEHRDMPVILDDAQGLDADPAGRNLLTSLTQTDPVKTLEWLSSTRILADLDVPMRFTTTSRVCVITNRWAGSAKEVEALEDRGHLVYFDPPPDEVHRYVASWLQRDAQDVYDFIGEHLHLIDRPSCRLYIKAVERKAAGGDWRALVLHHCDRTIRRVVQGVLDDPTCPTDAERLRKAKKLIRISRATYYRHKKKLVDAGQPSVVRPYKVGRVKLTTEPPPAVAPSRSETTRVSQPDDPGRPPQTGLATAG
jgi:hypothetical protein